MGSGSAVAVPLTTTPLVRVLPSRSVEIMQRCLSRTKIIYLRVGRRHSTEGGAKVITDRIAVRRHEWKNLLVIVGEQIIQCEEEGTIRVDYERE